MWQVCGEVLTPVGACGAHVSTMVQVFFIYCMLLQWLAVRQSFGIGIALEERMSGRKAPPRTRPVEREMCRGPDPDAAQ